ncbi:MAG: antioxidant, AhpC/TSA family protein, partial [Candidatus Eremiobacteraeota bacterium]|nr:antioxidant, AhpC/TSA family protein [Candidatus Eremiobacteraeota bacterium]
VEAHLFSEHIAEYRKLGATVIGVSGDDIETQKKFSTEECRASFLVASDPGLKIAKEYDAKYSGAYANRTSYVIAQDGTIAYAYTDGDPSKHVENTLTAVRALVKP